MSLDQPDGRQPDHPVAPQFPARWSPRSFTDQTLTKADVMSLLEAARWAPSASNLQPWRFVWALRGEPEFAAILGCLTGNNPLWAGRAAALIAVASKDRIPGRDGAEQVNRTAGFDTGAAWMSLALQAQAMGLVTHAMGGFGVDDLARVVALPGGHTLQAVVAVGHQGAAEALPETLRPREVPNRRQPLAETSFHGRF
ncbi:nitroreductase family protein [Tabrizicola sp.]|uniref:nitroreductase family protein n=1 Tax=Tabrizicola sp. TaxID=2005166 RepID=UPI003F381F6E